ncbi:MAG: transposase, partial [bacterium]
MVGAGERVSARAGVEVRRRSALNLNIHFHAIIPQGVFAEASDGEIYFEPGPPPSRPDMDKLAGSIRRRVGKVLARADGTATGEGLPSLEISLDPVAEELPTLAPLGAASIQGRAALGPRAGRRPRRRGREKARAGEPGRSRPRHRRYNANIEGFDLDASVRVRGGDKPRLERLLRYLLRPPIAAGRLHRESEDLLRLDLKRPWSDGTSSILFSPLELLERLAALVPRPHKNLVFYHGVFAPNARLRPGVVAYPGRMAAGSRPPIRSRQSATCRLRIKAERSWAGLMRRAFRIDALACPRCGGRLRLLATITDPIQIRRLLDHLGLESS